MSGAGDVSTHYTSKEKGDFFFLLQSQIRFVTADGYKAKSAKGKGRWGGEVQREPGTSFQESSLQSHTRHTSSLQQLHCDKLWEVL